MATTSIWSIKNRLKSAINYIINPEKTLNSEYGESNSFNYDWLHPEEDKIKREKVHFVSAINCGIETAYEEMILTKKSYSKEKGILAFHGYQSFKAGEVAPDKAHEIGIKFAEEVFGDRFEVIVSTHKNTKNIHNHYIVNSVSFKDGMKYNNSKQNYAYIRQISDSLCKEYGLSVLHKDEIKYTKYDKLYQNKILNDDYYKIAKEDIDDAISGTIVMSQFLEIMKKFGYEYYYRNDQLTIWKDGGAKIRVEKDFGKNYSVQNIKEKFGKSKYRQYKPISSSEVYNNYLSKNKPSKGIYGLYLYYGYLLKKFPIEYPKQKLSYQMRKEVYKLEKFSQQNRFMGRNNIETYDDLINFKDFNNQELSELKGKRENLWRKYNRAKTSDNKVKIYDEISDLNVVIKDLYKNRRYCKEIEERSVKMESDVNEFHNNLDRGFSKEKYRKYDR